MTLEKYFEKFKHQIIGWNQILEITEQAVIVKDHHIKGLGELEEYWKLKEKIRAPLPS